MAKSKSKSGVEESVNIRADSDRLPVAPICKMLIQAGHWNDHVKRFAWEILVTIFILLLGVLFFYLGSHHFDHRMWYHSISIISLPCAFIWTWLKTLKGPPFLSGDFGTPRSPKYLRRKKKNKFLAPSGMTKEEIAAAMQRNLDKHPDNVQYFENAISLPLI